MLTTTLSFSNMHTHGALFANILKARRKSFIVQRQWDLPETDGMEFDQYDTPQSRWIAVHEFGQVLAGIRLTPTIARCGVYSYMIRDAQQGMLGSIPTNLLYKKAPVSANVWESSRVFIAQHVPSHVRADVQKNLMSEMVETARSLGATQLLGLCPAVWGRWMQRIGMDTVPAGPVLDIEGAKNRVVKMTIQQALN